ncbi:hypothetical protein ACFL5Q_05180 [Planctomycetota bacterium]
MNYLGALLIVAGFVVILRALNVVAKTMIVVETARHAVAVLRNPEMDDDAKEAAMQRYALNLFGLFFVLLFGSALAILTPVGIVYLLDLAELLSLSSVLETTLSWDFIAATTALSLVIWWLMRRR